MLQCSDSKCIAGEIGLYKRLSDDLSSASFPVNEEHWSFKIAVGKRAGRCLENDLMLRKVHLYLLVNNTPNLSSIRERKNTDEAVFSKGSKDALYV